MLVVFLCLETQTDFWPENEGPLELREQTVSYQAMVEELNWRYWTWLHEGPSQVSDSSGLRTTQYNDRQTIKHVWPFENFIMTNENPRVRYIPKNMQCTINKQSFCFGHVGYVFNLSYLYLLFSPLLQIYIFGPYI